jgi:hypothetical protein
MARTKVSMELKAVRRALDRSKAQAEKAIKLGRQRIKANRRSGDRAKLRKNAAALKIALDTRATLPLAFAALDNVCCNQVYDCDPIFE